MKLKLAALALLATTTYSAAADMAAAPVPYTRAAAVAPAYNWTGFYIGAMGGGGWSRTAGADFNGAFAGGTIGANWQMSNFVLGIEGEGAWSNIGQNATAGVVGASDAVLVGAPVRAGTLSFMPTLSGVSGVMLFAVASSRMVMRCFRAIEDSVSPEATT